MGLMIEGLLRLQAVERDLAHVRGKLRTQANAVAVQQRKIDQAQQTHDMLHEQQMTRRKRSDGLDVDLKAKEEHVSKLRGNLNTARTNKEYAAILTEMNTFKADNARIEEEALRILQEIDAGKAELDAAAEALAQAQQRLDGVRQASDEEVERLTAMRNELQAKRDELAAAIDTEALYTFDRVAERYDGEAMAVIEVHGKKPPHSYVCGGCFMGLRAEHVNALQVKDDLRTCDNCGRILYLEKMAEKALET